MPASGSDAAPPPLRASRSRVVASRHRHAHSHSHPQLASRIPQPAARSRVGGRRWHPPSAIRIHSGSGSAKGGSQQEGGGGRARRSSKQAAAAVCRPVVGVCGGQARWQQGQSSEHCVIPRIQPAVQFSAVSCLRLACYAISEHAGCWAVGRKVCPANAAVQKLEEWDMQGTWKQGQRHDRHHRLAQPQPCALTI